MNRYKVSSDELIQICSNFKISNFKCQNRKTNLVEFNIRNFNFYTLNYTTSSSGIMSGPLTTLWYTIALIWVWHKRIANTIYIQSSWGFESAEILFTMPTPKKFCNLTLEKKELVKYAGVVIFLGRVVRLRIASYTTMRLPNQEVKHWRRFEGFVFTFILESQNQDNSTKTQSGRFSKYVFLLQAVTGNY